MKNTDTEYILNGKKKKNKVMKIRMKTKRPLHAILLLATLVTMTLQANVAYGEEEPVAPERSAKKQSEAKVG